MATYILIRVPEMNDGTKDLIYFLHCLGIIFISIMAGLRKDVLAYVVASVSIIYSFVFFIKFMNISFQDLKTKFITRLKLIHIYVIAVILVCLTIFIYIKHNALATKYIILLISFLFLLTIYLLFKFYIKSKQSYYFKFIRMIMMSLIISAIPFVVLFVIPSLMNKQGIIGVEMIAIFFLFVPICLFYMIIAGKLFDLNFIIRRAQYYILLSMCLTGFLVILGILIFHNKGDNILDVIRFGFIVFISMSLFLFLKDYLDFRLRGRLYHYQKKLSV
ncbi:hypothetical protein ACT7CX_18060 [Bacillus cereus]